MFKAEKSSWSQNLYVTTVRPFATKEKKVLLDSLNLISSVINVWKICKMVSNLSPVRVNTFSPGWRLWRVRKKMWSHFWLKTQETSYAQGSKPAFLSEVLKKILLETFIESLILNISLDTYFSWHNYDIIWRKCNAVYQVPYGCPQICFVLYKYCHFLWAPWQENLGRPFPSQCREVSKLMWDSLTS